MAIVGENGSGKSTLPRLITGILLADKGTASWDGIDLSHADSHTVWALTGLVPQNFARWPLHVRENVTLGRPRTADDGSVGEATDAVGMRNAVEDLHHGLDMLLARELWGGVELSGGPFQRNACSRALYRRPSLLIMDEPAGEGQLVEAEAGPGAVGDPCHALDERPGARQRRHTGYGRSSDSSASSSRPGVSAESMSASLSSAGAKRSPGRAPSIVSSCGVRA
ncbi:hypothetical protein GCM10010289_63290 [Streptomyces violascens]|uniref:ABC transporter domain-containing protein n=1 Tax=Streptomyces violascens TaxID=67381 RepID=A0ABQ3QSL7_9ACTN|nr:hypothetical protein GCM10010289_63290 [Streptomyces violascens]GHI40270.1 hypothetical protein Sviol_46780 [Streptomyces violascens]